MKNKHLSKCLMVILAFLLCFALLSAAIPSLAADKKPEYSWRFQSLLPPELLDSLNTWAEQVNIMSSGRIEIKIYSGGELVPEMEKIKAVAYNTIQMAESTGAMYEKITTGDMDTLIVGGWRSPMQTLAARYMWEDGKLFEIQSEEYANHKP